MLRPLCKCHGEEMVRAGVKKESGRQKWECSVKRRKRQRVYQHRYRHSPLGRETNRRYMSGSGYLRRRFRNLLREKEEIVLKLGRVYGSEQRAA